MTTSGAEIDFGRIVEAVVAGSANAAAHAPARKAEPVTWNLPGFGGKVRIGTVFGDLPIEALRVRDEVRTNTGKIARVQWIDKICLDDDFLYHHPSAVPTCIAAGAFGAGKPMGEMVVSPRQEVCPESHVATRFLCADELGARFNALRARPTGLTYYRFHCGEPVVVRAEGVWVRVRP
jgi:hypothetical protein